MSSFAKGASHTPPTQQDTRTHRAAVARHAAEHEHVGVGLVDERLRGVAVEAAQLCVYGGGGGGWLRREEGVLEGLYKPEHIAKTNSLTATTATTTLERTRLL